MGSLLRTYEIPQWPMVFGPLLGQNTNIWKMPITKTKQRTQPMACQFVEFASRTGRVQTTKLKYLSNCYHLQKVVFNTYNKCHCRPCSVFLIRESASQSSAGSGEPLWGAEVQWCRMRPWRVPWNVKCVLLACSVLLPHRHDVA